MTHSDTALEDRPVREAGSAASRDEAPRQAPQRDQRWLALAVLCLGTLMIVLDTTIVNVALPSIQSNLHFTESSLAWVVNAYLLTFGGFLLLGGRLGDLFGHRRLFVAGIGLFSLASLGCGLAGSQWFLIGARAVQGLGGAVVSAVSLSLIMTLFPAPAERARAMGLYGFVAAGGGSVGLLLGGVLTDLLNWHAIFLVNVPLGATVLALSLRFVPGSAATSADRHLDLAGAATVTAALVLAVYAIVNGGTAGWTSPQTLGLLVSSLALLIGFVVIEARVPSPLMPLRSLWRRNLMTASLVGVLWSAAMFAWFFLSSLYLQLVLGYRPLAVGLAFLPGDVITAVLSLGISAKLVVRYGIRTPMSAGLVLIGAGLVLLGHAPAGGHYVTDVLPSMVLLGIGAGLALNPVLLAAMSDVDPRDAGLASGVTNTALMMGAALGLASLASLASSRTGQLTAAGSSPLAALTGGYHLAFLVAGALALLAAIIGAALIRSQPAGEPSTSA